MHSQYGLNAQLFLFAVSHVVYGFGLIQFDDTGHEQFRFFYGREIFIFIEINKSFWSFYNEEKFFQFISRKIQILIFF